MYYFKRWACAFWGLIWAHHLGSRTPPNSCQNREFSSSLCTEFHARSPCTLFMDLLAQSSLRDSKRYHVVPCSCFSLCVKWDGPSLKLDTGWWLTEEILCCQNPWKCQKEMSTFLYIFLNSCFESISQMLSLDSSVLQDDALFLVQLRLCPPILITGAGRQGASSAELPLGQW